MATTTVASGSIPVSQMNGTKDQKVNLVNIDLCFFLTQSNFFEISLDLKLIVIGLEQSIINSISNDEHAPHLFQILPKLKIRMSSSSSFHFHIKTLIIVAKIEIILNVVVSVFVVNILGMFSTTIILNGIKNNIPYQLIIMHMDIFLKIMHLTFVVMLKQIQNFLLN